MKFTDFKDDLDRIKYQEIKELSEVVRAWGGTFTFDEDCDPTIVLVETDDWAGNVEIAKITIVDGELNFIGYDNTGFPIECTAEHIVVGHISCITEAILA